MAEEINNVEEAGSDDDEDDVAYLFEHLRPEEIEWLNIFQATSPDVMLFYTACALASPFRPRRLVYEALFTLGMQIARRCKKAYAVEEIEFQVSRFVTGYSAFPHLVECFVVPIFDSVFEQVEGNLVHCMSQGNAAADHQLECSRLGVLLKYRGTSFQQLRTLWPSFSCGRDMLQSAEFGIEGDPRMMSMDELRQAIEDEGYGLELTQYNRRKVTHKMISRMLRAPVHESVTSMSFVYVSREYPFTVEVMRTGKIVMEFSVQRYSRANANEEWVYANAQLVPDE